MLRFKTESMIDRLNTRGHLNFETDADRTLAAIISLYPVECAQGELSALLEALRFREAAAFNEGDLLGYERSITAAKQAFKLPAMYGFNSIAYLLRMPEKYLQNLDLVSAQVSLYFARAIAHLHPARVYFQEVYHFLLSSQINFNNGEEVFEIVSQFTEAFKQEHNDAGALALIASPKKDEFILNLQRIDGMHPNSPALWVVLATVYYSYFGVMSMQGSYDQYDIQPARTLERINRSAIKFHPGFGTPNLASVFSITRLPQDYLDVDYDYVYSLLKVAKEAGLQHDREGLMSLGLQLERMPEVVTAFTEFSAQYYAK
jgi:hypothetical protein